MREEKQVVTCPLCGAYTRDFDPGEDCPFCGDDYLEPPKRTNEEKLDDTFGDWA
jgi:rubrerythrin